MNDVFNVVALGTTADIVDRPTMLNHFHLGLAVLSHYCQKLFRFDSSVWVGLAKRDDPLRNMPGPLKHFLYKDFGVGFREHTDVFGDFLFREDTIEHMVFLFIRAGFGIGRIKIDNIAFDSLQEVKDIHAANFVLLVILEYPSVDDIFEIQQTHQRML